MPPSPLPLSHEAQECIDWAISCAMLYEISPVLPEHLLLSVLSHHRTQAFLGSLLPPLDILLQRLLESLGPVYAGYMDQLLLNGMRNPSIVSVRLGHTKRILKTFERPTITFANLPGLDEAKRELQGVVEFLKTPLEVQLPVRTAPVGVALVGPRTSQRTLFVRAIAGEANVPLLSLSWQTLFSVTHEVEQGTLRIEDLNLPVREYNLLKSGRGLIRGLFDLAAKTSPCLVLIDGIDSLARVMNSETGKQLLAPLFTETIRANKRIVLIVTTDYLDEPGHSLLAPDRLGKHVRVVYLDQSVRLRSQFRLQGIPTPVRSTTPTVIPTAKTSFCPSCKRPVQLNWKHCVFCGVSLASVCPKCGAPRPDIEGARFCFECGSPLDVQDKPTPKQLVQQMLKKANEQHNQGTYAIDQNVHILDGPFAGFTGAITAIDSDQKKITVLITFFGRETPVVLDFQQVERIKP